MAKSTVTTGKAADRTVANMVAKSKSGKGTLSYTDNNKAPPFKKKGAK